MSLRALREWWDALPPQLRPEPGADPSKKDYGYFLHHMAHAWERHGAVIFEHELADDGRTLTAEMRAAAIEFSAWFAPIADSFQTDVAERLAHIRTQCRESIDEYERLEVQSREAGHEYLIHNYHAEVCGHRLPIDFVRVLSECDDPAPPRTGARIAEHITCRRQQIESLVTDPWASPLIDAIGCRLRDIRLENVGFQTGLWQGWPVMEADGYVDDETGQQIPPERWQGPMFAAELVWDEKIKSFPVRTLQRIRFRMQESPWFTAYTLNCLLNASDREHFGGAVFLLWELERPFHWWHGETSGASPLNSWSDWFEYRKFRLECENLPSKDAQKFALACGFLVTRILELAGRTPAPKPAVASNEQPAGKFSATAAAIEVAPPESRSWRDLTDSEKGAWVLHFLMSRPNPTAAVPGNRVIAKGLSEMGMKITKGPIGELRKNPPENLRRVLESLEKERDADHDSRERKLRVRGVLLEPDTND